MKRQVARPLAVRCGILLVASLVIFGLGRVSLGQNAAAGAGAAAAVPAPGVTPRPLAVENLGPAGLLGDVPFLHESGIMHPRYVNQGRQILSISHDSIRIWDRATGKLVQRLDDPSGKFLHNAYMLPDGQHVISVGVDPQFKIWNLATGRVERHFTEFLLYVVRMAMVPGGKEAITSGSAGTLSQWDLEAGKKIKEFKGHKNDVYALAVAPDGKTVVSGSHDKTVAIWDIASGERLQTITDHTHQVNSVAINPKGDRFVSASSDKTVRLWELPSGKAVWNVTVAGEAYGAAYSPDGASIAVGMLGGPIVILDAKDGHVRTNIPVTHRLVISALFSESEKQIRTEDDDMAVGGGVFKLPGDQKLDFSPDGKQLLGSIDFALAEWDVASGKRNFPPVELGNSFPPGTMPHLAVAPDGGRLYSAGDDGGIRTWDLATGKPAGLIPSSHAITALALSSDGRKLLAVSSGGARVIDARDGKVLKTLALDRRPSSGSAGRWFWGADDKTIIAGGIGPVRFDAATGEGEPLAASAVASLAAVSPDGSLAVVGAMTATDQPDPPAGGIQIWSLTANAKLTDLGSAADWSGKKLTAARFLPGGRGVLTGTSAGVVQYWTASSAGAAAADPAVLAGWVKDLGANDFNAREAATTKLIDAGLAAEAALAKADMNDPEVKQRVATVRQGLEKHRAPDHAVGTPLELKVEITALALHPGGRQWAAIVGPGPTAQVVLGELSDQGLREVIRLPIDGRTPQGVVFTPDGQTLCVGNKDGTVALFRSAPAPGGAAPGAGATLAKMSDPAPGAADGAAAGQEFPGVQIKTVVKLNPGAKMLQIETSPDNRRVLAVIQQGSLWYANLDGQQAGPFDKVIGVQFSPDSKRSAYITQRGGKTVPVVDGEDQPAVVTVLGTKSAGPAWSPDSKHFGYAATLAEGEDTTMIVDGKPMGKAYRNMWGPFFSPDSQHVAYNVDQPGVGTVIDGGDPVGQFHTTDYPIWAPDSKRWGLVTRPSYRYTEDGVPGPDFKYMRDIEYSPDSKHVAYVASNAARGGFGLVVDGEMVTPGGGFVSGFFQGRALHYMPDGKLHFVLCPDDKNYVWYVDGQERARLPHVHSKYGSNGAISKDGTRFAVGTRLPDKTWVLQIDGKTWGPYEELGTVVFSPDSKHCAAIVQRDGKLCIMRDEKVGPAWDNIIKGSLVFSLDGQHLAFWAGKEGETVLAIDDRAATPPQILPPAREIGPLYHSDGTMAKENVPVFHDDGTCSGVLASDKQVEVVTVPVQP